MRTRPVLVGPVTLLLISKPDHDAPGGFRYVNIVDRLIPDCAELLRGLHGVGVDWVQLDEPSLRNLVNAAARMRNTLS